MGVRTITLPPTLNRRCLGELMVALEEATQNPSVRVVVLEGSSEGFCGGLDLDELGRGSLSAEPRDSKVGYTEPTPWRDAAEDFCRCLRALMLSTKPTLAVVDAAALGGGVGLAAACDVVLASDRATFGFPEVLLGLAPAMILPALLERITPQRARLWAITGVTRGATEALAAGLVDVVVSPSKLASEAKRWTKMLGRGNPRGVVMTKELCREVPRLSALSAIELGRAATVGALDDPELRHRIAQFREFGVLPWEEG